MPFNSMGSVTEPDSMESRKARSDEGTQGECSESVVDVGREVDGCL